MQLNLFQGTGTSAKTVDRCADAASMHVFDERPSEHKNLTRQVSPQEEGEALLAELGKALEAFADAYNRPTNERLKAIPKQHFKTNG